MNRPNRNKSIERKVAIILAMPDPPKKIKPTQKQIFVNNAILILNRFEQKINQAISFNK